MQGLEHANYANAAENLAAALQRKGQWDEARELMHKALETRRWMGCTFFLAGCQLGLLMTGHR